MDSTQKSEPASGRGPSIPRIDASTLLASSREIILVHNQQEYRLRITSNDKLILTK
jgi:hemin uptake protein HemP